MTALTKRKTEVFGHNESLCLDKGAAVISEKVNLKTNDQLHGGFP